MGASRARAGPTEGMTPESGPSLLRRVRWGNLARLGAALAALALVLAWPRLRPREPRLEIWRRLSFEWKLDLTAVRRELTLSDLPAAVGEMLAGKSWGRVIVRPRV